MFASNLRKLGGKVSLVVWKQSEHVGMMLVDIGCLVLNHLNLFYRFIDMMK